MKININTFICKLLVLTCLIPLRGAIFGISGLGGKIRLFSFLLLILWRRSIEKVKIPGFYWFYFISYTLCVLHFRNSLVPLQIIEMLFAIIGVMYCVLTTIKCEKHFLSVIDFIIAIFAIYSILGIIESIFHWNFFDVLTGTQVEYIGANEIRFGLARNRGAYGVSINNGMILCLEACLTLYRMASSKNITVAYKVAYALIVLDAFLTLSRAVWLYLAFINIAVYLSMSLNKKVSLISKMFIVGLLILVLLSMFLPTALTSVLDIADKMIGSILETFGLTAEENEVGDLGNRLDLWAWVWLSVRDSLLWGKGFLTQFSYNLGNWNKESIEITWLYVLFRTGFIGLCGYLVFQIGCVYSAIKNITKNMKINLSEKFSFYFLIGTIGYFFAQFSASSDSDLVFYYILLALLISKSNLDNRNLVMEETYVE